MGDRADASAPALETCRVIEGEGPCVVLIHGVGLDHHMWGFQAAALRDRFTVLRYDLPGHGGTPPRPGTLDLDDLVTQLAALLDEVNIPRAHVAGFSLGALVAQAFALTHGDRIERLVLISGVYDRDGKTRDAVRKRLERAERDGPPSITRAAIERWFTGAYRSSHPRQIEMIEQRLRANTPEGFLPAYRLFANADRQLASRLKNIEAPTLVITGEHDTGSTPEMARRMSEAIPNAECRIVAGVRHMLPLEAADELNALLSAFLEGREKQP